MYVIEHDGDLSQMPKWWEWWYASLRPQWQARDLYLRLCRPEYAESEKAIADRLLAHQANLSKFALERSLHALEAIEFLSLFEDEGTTFIKVFSPPKPTSAEEQQADVIGKQRRETEHQAADEFVKIWKRDFEKTFNEAYLPNGLDQRMAQRLAHNEPDWKGIRAVIEYYWHYENDDQYKRFSAFATEYDRFATEKGRLERNML